MSENNDDAYNATEIELRAICEQLRAVGRYSPRYEHCLKSNKFNVMLVNEGQKVESTESTRPLRQDEEQASEE